MSVDLKWLRSLPLNRITCTTEISKTNQMYYAERVQARKDWARTHAEPEPGRGLDGRPLQRGKAVTKDA